jgi:hypothetical protein
MQNGRLGSLRKEANSNWQVAQLKKLALGSDLGDAFAPLL